MNTGNGTRLLINEVATRDGFQPIDSLGED